MSATTDDRPDEARADRGELVYGVIDDGEPYFVFLGREEALQLQELRDAWRASATWGEFRQRVGEEEFASVLEGFQDTVAYEDFADELRAEAEDEGRTLTDAEVDAAWAELPVGDRPPRDEDPFEPSQVYGYLDGDYPSSWPARDMACSGCPGCPRAGHGGGHPRGRRPGSPHDPRKSRRSGKHRLTLGVRNR